MTTPEVTPTFNASDYRLEECTECEVTMAVPAHAKRRCYVCRECISLKLAARCDANARAHRLEALAAGKTRAALCERIARARNGGAA